MDCRDYDYSEIHEQFSMLLTAMCTATFSLIFIQYDKLLYSEDNRYILSSFLAFFKLVHRERAKLCNLACVERRTPLNKYGVHIAAVAAPGTIWGGGGAIEVQTNFRGGGGVAIKLQTNFLWGGQLARRQTNSLLREA